MKMLNVFNAKHLCVSCNACGKMVFQTEISLG